MKKLLTQNERGQLPIKLIIREVNILQSLKHDNIVNLLEICRGKATPYRKVTLYLIFEFCEHDLAGLLRNPDVKFSLAEIKMVMQQLLNGLYYIHSNKILHRDVKPANILMTKTGKLKLADFGLARATSERMNSYTNRVVTLWYRPPELLLGEKNYTPAIDLWGAGCILAEMWTRSPIMPADTEQRQLILISQMCGSIVPEVWPGVEKLELFTKIHLPKGERRKVKARLCGYIRDRLALDLLDKLLILDPSKRANADDALNHDFFWMDPLPQELKSMFSRYGKCMFEHFAFPGRHAQNNRPVQNNRPAQPRAAAPALFDPDQYVERIY